MLLPIFQDTNRNFVMMQNKWKSILDAFLGKPQNNSNLLNGVVLANGSTTVNHGLGRKLQGWKVIGQSSRASIFDQQASNQRPDLTLILVSDSVVTVNLEVF